VKQEKLLQEDSFWQVNNPVLWGLLVTILIGVIAVLLATSTSCYPAILDGPICETKWQQFLSSTPNEIGDSLAGFSGSLAFVWIIVTVMMQKRELSLQRLEIRKMISEGKQQNAHLEELVDAQEKVEVDNQISSLVKILENQLREAAFLCWNVRTGPNGGSPHIYFIHKDSLPKDESIFVDFHRRLNSAKASLAGLEKNQAHIVAPEKNQNWKICLETINSVLVLASRASEGQQNWLRHTIQLPSLMETMTEIYDNDSNWAPQ
jgi:hypothetical protein